MSIHFSAARGEGDMRKNDYDPDKDGRLDKNNLQFEAGAGAGVIPAINIGIKKKYVIGNPVILAHDAEASIGPGDYTLLKTITISELKPSPTTLRIQFALRSSTTDNFVYGRIYKNGVAVGTERQMFSLTYATYIEDLEFAKGDAIQLYAHGAVNSVAYIRNFRVSGDKTQMTLDNALSISSTGADEPLQGTNS